MYPYHNKYSGRCYYHSDFNLVGGIFLLFGMAFGVALAVLNLLFNLALKRWRSR